MTERAYEVLPGNHGTRIKVNARGSAILRIPRLNRGTAFTQEERQKLGLIGLLPAHSTPLEGQLHRTYQRFLAAGSPLQQFAYLRGIEGDSLPPETKPQYYPDDEDAEFPPRT